MYHCICFCSIHLENLKHIGTKAACEWMRYALTEKLMNPGITYWALAMKGNMKPSTPTMSDPTINIRWVINHSPLGSTGFIQEAKKIPEVANKSHDIIINIPTAMEWDVNQ